MTLLIAYLSYFPGFALLPIALVMHSSFFDVVESVNDLAIYTGGRTSYQVTEQFHRISANPPVCISGDYGFSYSVLNRIYRLGCLLFLLEVLSILG